MPRLYRLSRLKEHRERRGLSQHELTKLSDVSRPTIARLETTDTRAKPETARKLAKALKVRSEDLYW
ncbi:MAG: transcriptional regulator [Actinobacteria bacterium]|nr:MAG: transcriptional regulator [Actinomycetota bacterium]